jgi:hypothetical protein
MHTRWYGICASELQLGYWFHVAVWVPREHWWLTVAEVGQRSREGTRVRCSPPAVCQKPKLTPATPKGIIS